MPKKKEELIADIKKNELGIKKLSDFSAQEQALYERLHKRYSFNQLNEVESAYNKAAKSFKTIVGGFADAHSANVVKTTQNYQKKIDRVIGEEHPEYQWEKELETLKTENEKISEERDSLNEQWEQYVLEFGDDVEIANLGDLDTIYDQMVNEINAENKKREEESKQQGVENFSKADEYDTSVNNVLVGRSQDIVNKYYNKSNKYYENVAKIDELNEKISEVYSQKEFKVVKDPYASEKVDALKKERDEEIAANDAQLRESKKEQLAKSEKIENLGKYIEIRKSISSSRAEIDGDKQNDAWEKLNEKQAEFDKLNWFQQFWAKRLPASWYGKAELFQEIEARKDVMKEIGYFDIDITDKYREYNEKKEQEVSQKESKQEQAKQEAKRKEQEEREMEQERQKEKKHAEILEQRANEKMAQWKEDAEKEKNQPVNDNKLGNPEKKDMGEELYKILKETADKNASVRENVGDMFAKDTNVGGFAKEGEQKSEFKQNEMQKGAPEMNKNK